MATNGNQQNLLVETTAFLVKLFLKENKRTQVAYYAKDGSVIFATVKIFDSKRNT